MNLTSLTRSDIERLTRLFSRRDALAYELEALNQELESFGSEKQAEAPVARSGGRPPTAPAKTGRGRYTRRGGMKDSIIAVLKAAGKEGLAVRDIAAKLKVKPANVHVWFGTTGKQFSQIQKQDGKRVWKD